MPNLMKTWKTYNGLLFLKETFRTVMDGKVFCGKNRALHRERYGRRTKLSAAETNDCYRELILSGKPFLAGRLGSAEMRRVNRYVMKQLGLCKGYKEAHIRSVLLNKSPALADWYAEQIISLLPNVDIMPVWCPIGEAYLVRQFAKKAKLTHLADIEPFFYEHPWTAALKGKKVLVINPFDESIRLQYKKRELLFENPEILPEFELHTLKSVMVLTPEDNTYGTIIDAVDYMYEEAMKTDFDIALLGCGPQGMILAERFRQQGKQAIYLGGVLQILFGIKGSRWDVMPTHSTLYNEHWIYPVEEPPKGAEKLDSACYWKQGRQQKETP